MIFLNINSLFNVMCINLKTFSYDNVSFLFLFLLSWSGVRLSPLGTSAANWPVVPASDDRYVWSSQWNENWQGKPKYSEKNCPGPTLSTTDPTWPDLGSNPGRRGGKPATNRLSYAKAYDDVISLHYTVVPSFQLWRFVKSNKTRR
jgi:hypothetical protein